MFFTLLFIVSIIFVITNNNFHAKVAIEIELEHNLWYL